MASYGVQGLEAASIENRINEPEEFRPEEPPAMIRTSLEPSMNKAVYVVLLRSKSFLSGAIRLIKSDRYTHAAIALDAELQYMFSFGRRRAWNPFVGCFKRERLDSAFYIKHRQLPGVVLRIPLDEEQYAGIASDIWRFLLDGHSYGFNVFGMIRASLGHEWKAFDKKFFCSEFVYYILHKNGVCDLGQSRTVVRPQMLLTVAAEKIYEGDLLKYSVTSCHKAGAEPFAGVLPEAFRKSVYVSR
ncbi:MAG: hypothetical protein FWG40_08545 [Peptococcaceae bacterium]|nr:hypothetical protein [Peptococcaceae bacterium]